MKLVLKVLSFLGLVLTVVPSFFVLAGQLSWNSHSRLMLAGLLIWFATAPLWMRKQSD